MFEKELADRFQQIFGLKKVIFDTPGESHEQDCLFIEIETSKNKIKDGKVLALVSGNAVLYGNSSKIPFGFFSKAIENAPPILTKDLFFHEIENNTRQFRDIVQRGFSFTYFFNSQYDPAVGTITSVDINIEEQQT